MGPEMLHEANLNEIYEAELFSPGYWGVVTLK